MEDRTNMQPVDGRGPWRFSREPGFTLIEVLVAVLVLAIGILGVAGMQAVSVRESSNLYFRTQADLLIADIVDRMRVNRAEARGQQQGGRGSAYDGASTRAAAGGAGCRRSSCNSAALAAYDVAAWSEALRRSGLPAAEGAIAHQRDSLSDLGDVVGSVYSIQIFWDERRDGQGRSSGQACQPVASPGQSCRSLVVEI